eukprot:5103891-Lingulodinium_polyedra.AAC.1
MLDGRLRRAVPCCEWHGRKPVTKGRRQRAGTRALLEGNAAVQKVRSTAASGMGRGRSLYKVGWGSGLGTQGVQGSGGW